MAGGITLWETPGHTPQDITTIVKTPEATVALTHVWWHQGGPLVTRIPPTRKA